MSDRVAYLGGRALPRLALTGLALIWLAGCSADVTRFEASSPFSNPFAPKTYKLPDGTSITPSIKVNFVKHVSGTNPSSKDAARASNQ